MPVRPSSQETRCDVRGTFLERLPSTDRGQFSCLQLGYGRLPLFLRSVTGQGNPLRPRSQAAILCGVRAVRGTPSTYCAPAYTAGSNSAPLSRRKVDSATCNSFQINAVAFSTFLKRLAAVVRSRTVAKGDSTTFVVLRCGQCSRGNW